jgi:hypothetical protein
VRYDVALQATVFFAEIADVEQNFCVLAVKLFENYGYKYSNNTGGSNFSSVLSNDSCAHVSSGAGVTSGGVEAQETAKELISEFESPLTRVGWDSMIRAGE